MGRTAKFDRQQALETCVQLIWRHGYENCSVKFIAETLGITRSSFYNAFGSRESLFLEVLEYYLSHGNDRILHDVPQTTAVKPLITRFFHNVCASLSADSEARGCLAVNCATQLIGVDSELGPIIEDRILRNVKRFTYLLELAVSQGELTDTHHLEHTALALQNLLLGLSVMARMIHSQTDLCAVADQTLQGLGLLDTTY